jgi:hypothetical protein
VTGGSGEIETVMPRPAFDASAHHRRVLGQVEQDRPGLRQGVLAQACRGRGAGKLQSYEMSSAKINQLTVG